MPTFQPSSALPARIGQKSQPASLVRLRSLPRPIMSVITFFMLRYLFNRDSDFPA